MKRRILSLMLAGLLAVSCAPAGYASDLLSDGGSPGAVSGEPASGEYLREEAGQAGLSGSDLILAEAEAAAAEPAAELLIEDPESPEEPGTPGSPAASGSPEEPEALVVPGAPESSADPGTPDSPAASGSPADPAGEEDILSLARQLLAEETASHVHAQGVDVPESGAPEEKAEPITDMFSYSWDALVEKMIKSGTPQGNNKYRLSYSDKILAVDATTRFDLDMSKPDDQSLLYTYRWDFTDGYWIVDMTFLKKYPNTALINFIYMDGSNWITGETEIPDTDSYIMADTLTFKKNNSSATSPISDFQETANTTLRLGFAAWQSKLQKEMGFGMNRLHFHSYGQDTPKKDHVYDTAAIGKMTFDKDGWEGKKCSICGQEKKEKTISHVGRIALDYDTFFYDGKRHVPTVYVLDTNNKQIPAAWLKIEMPSGSTEIGTYSVKITLQGDYAEGSTSVNYKIIKEMGTPIITSLSNEQKGVQIKWTKADGAGQYYIFRKDPFGAWKKIGTVGAEVSTYLDDSTKYSGYTYAYKVQAVRGSLIREENDTGKSIVWLPTPLTTHAFNVTAGINVRWTEITGAASYRIYRRTKNTGYQKIASVNASLGVNYKDTDVKDGEEYIYTVRAAKGNTLSSYYNNGKMCVRLPISRVYRLDNNAGGVGIKWADVGYMQGYKVLQKDGNDWKEIKETAGNISYYTDAATKTGYNKYYTYSVRGYTKTSRNELCLAAFSTIGKTIYRLAPSTVKSVTNSAAGKATMTWTAVANATGYEIEYADNNKFTSPLTLKVTGKDKTSQTITGLKKGSTYYFRIRARKLETKADYYGVYSNIKNVKIEK